MFSYYLSLCLCLFKYRDFLYIYIYSLFHILFCFYYLICNCCSACCSGVCSTRCHVPSVYCLCRRMKIKLKVNSLTPVKQVRQFWWIALSTWMATNWFSHTAAAASHWCSDEKKTTCSWTVFRFVSTSFLGFLQMNTLVNTHCYDLEKLGLQSWEPWHESACLSVARRHSFPQNQAGNRTPWQKSENKL